jgi:preprotein translocase subunit SecA
MALADIQKKGAEERKREKRLVHLTNSLARDYLDSDIFQKKAKAEKPEAEYLVKSMLDYLFFEERKELRELQSRHIHDFMMVYAPHKLNLSAEAGKNAPAVMISFLSFLEHTGHIRNGMLLSEEVRANKNPFLKLMPKPVKTTKKKTAAAKKTRKTKTVKKEKADIKVGRNDPCPCGSGKKYKKCCGQTE